MKTQEEIQQYNKRCAEFLGWKLNGHAYIFDESIFTFSKSNVFIDDLMFHSDWNWIHEVIEAIEKLSKKGETYMFSITKFSIRVSYKGSRIVDLPIDFTKKEAVVEAINQFLICYKNK